MTSVPLDNQQRASLRSLIGSWKSEPRSHRYALMAIFLLGAALRTAFLFQPVVHDEASTFVYFTSRPFSVGLSYYPYPNNHLFHTLLVHLSTRVFGTSVWALRLPAFLAGLLVIPATYLVVRKLTNKNAALIATALVAVSSGLIFYSTSARGYTLQTLIFLAMILVAIRLQRTDRTGDWLWLIGLGALCFYTIPTALYPVGALLIWMLLSSLAAEASLGRRAFIKKLVLATVSMAALTFLLYLPVFMRSGIGSLSARGSEKSLSWSVFFHDGFYGIGRLSRYLAGEIPLVIAGILVAGFLLALIFNRKITEGKVSLPLVIILWCAGLVLLQRVIPYPRVFIPFFPLFYGYAAAGLLFVAKFALARLRSWKPSLHLKQSLFDSLVLGMALLLGLLVLVSSSPYQPKDQITFPDARRVALYLRGSLRPGDVVYLEPNVRKSLEFYFLMYGIDTAYLYGFEGRKPEPEAGGRAILIDVKQKRFPVEKTLKYGHIDGSQKAVLRKLHGFPSSDVYVVGDVRLPSHP